MHKGYAVEIRSVRQRKRGNIRLAALATLAAIAVFVAVLANPAPADAGPSYDDGRIIAHDLTGVEWAWDLEFKFNNAGREHHGLLRTYAGDGIKYQTVVCDIVGDVSFSSGSSGKGEAHFDGGYLACPMPAMLEGIDASHPDLVTVAARFERDGSGRQPLVFHPDVTFSLLGSSSQTQFEIWTAATGTARSPLYSDGGRNTVRSTIEQPEPGADFTVLHHLSGRAPTAPRATNGPQIDTDATMLYIGHSPHWSGSRFTGDLEHLFIDPGKFSY